ncbi:hypothetical protein CC1G_10895 [Coprinopsis cinerea okayama7|uniref:3-beta hydroxysteroid dehydrogenase/isomerase domain-containing protein n=1 Tax=Coprinopsis cinerea (strain Okayama-7 / 130 / ATCC MYA-4618 / FGSC 9003) TaxID=240176 RepID=A8P5V7_COPC7|nr:hypothetical protein CC1G_10895 [Coprinopsis cinerea okayama7\|eukprot:XP_001839032.1 hypothetical protein CC1G_10895 [Coprinopsis cinerea okayama7\
MLVYIQHTAILGLAWALFAVSLLAAYIWGNDRRLVTIPESVQALGLEAVTPEDVKAEVLKVQGEASNGKRDEEKGESYERELEEQLPPRTGRRYIVVGGGGFLGGWIVLHLLKRGEDPMSIRIVDLAPTPVNPLVREQVGEGRGVEYVRADVTDERAIEEAFSAPWSDEEARNSVQSGAHEGEKPTRPGLTIFHAAASVRFFERHPAFLPRSTSVNVDGTLNVLRAATSSRVNADVLVYTSSAAVGCRSHRALGWPWEGPPERLYQVINEGDGGWEDDKNVEEQKKREDYCSTYHQSKAIAETLVRSWDGRTVNLPDGRTMILRTGCIRPGNAIYGPYGACWMDDCLERGSTPAWQAHVVSSFVYVENASLAHLLYEQRLLDAATVNRKGEWREEKEGLGCPVGRALPDIGGQTFCVTDPGPPVSFRDIHTIMGIFTNGTVRFTHISITFMVLLSHLFEAYSLLQHYVGRVFPLLGKHLPMLSGHLQFIQPAMFNGNTCHFVVDDRKARRSPGEGGLGYKGVWTTKGGVVKTLVEYYSGVSTGLERDGQSTISRSRVLRL